MKLQRIDYFDAVQKSLKNAEELIDEGRILSKYKKIARAYTLYQMAIEEIGKAALTFSFVLYENIEDATAVRKFLNDFQDHKRKTSVSLGVDLLFALNTESKRNEKILNNFIEKFDKTATSNKYKNYSLYTSLIENKFYLPSEIITEELLSNIEYFADFRLKVAKPFFELGMKNFEVLFETRNDFDKEEAIKEGVEKMKKKLGLN